MAAMNSKTACAPSPKSWPCYNLILSTKITTVTLHMVNYSTFSHAKFGSQRRKLDLETANVRSKNAEKMRSIGKQSCKPLTLKTLLLFARDQIGCRGVAWPFCFCQSDMLSILTHVNEGLHACKGWQRGRNMPRLSKIRISKSHKEHQDTSRITSLEGIF